MWAKCLTSNTLRIEHLERQIKTTILRALISFIPQKNRKYFRHLWSLFYFKKLRPIGMKISNILITSTGQHSNERLKWHSMVQCCCKIHEIWLFHFHDVKYPTHTDPHFIKSFAMLKFCPLLWVLAMFIHLENLYLWVVSFIWQKCLRFSHNSQYYLAV